MRCIELFAGGGGTSVGLHRAGFLAALRVEWDHDACETLRAAFPGEPLFEGDVRLADYSAVGEVDLCWASFPCQCWSVAGKRLGAQDVERNGWPWTLDVLDRVRPTWVVCENVVGLTHHAVGSTEECRLDPMVCPRHYMDQVILPQLRERFDYVDWRVLDAANFGVPQRRERIIFVGGPSPFSWPEPTHCDPAQATLVMFGGQEPWVTVREALGRPFGTPTRIPLVYEMKTSKWNRGPSDRFRRQPHGKASGLMATIGAATVPIVLVDDEPGDRVVRLSMTECAALQSFPPNHPFQGGASAQRRQVGNAVPPPLAEALGRAINERLR